MLMATEYEAAFDGIPLQGPEGIATVRISLAAIVGPPNGPLGRRVSKTRHGTMAMKCEGADGSELAAMCRCPVLALARCMDSNGTCQFCSGVSSSAKAFRQNSRPANTTKVFILIAAS